MQMLKNFSFKNFWQSFKPKKFWLVFVLVFAILLGTFFATSAFATSDGAAESMFNAILRVCTAMAVGLATLCIKLSIFILEYLIEIAGYNGYLDTPAVQVGWVMVRDVTNMFFVIILLIIAFGTILGVEQYEWKKMMVKFVLAAILVNFSRTICGLFIDAAQVFMVTFVNAVSATAGGNLIRMFKMDEIVSFSRSVDPKDVSDTNVFIAACGALLFAAILMSVMLAYLVILLMRMLVLWVLIVLSPLAFVLSLLPQTQGQAQRWWKEFGNHVAVGPVVIFFIWLSFATAGAGNIHDDIQKKSIAQMNTDAVEVEAATLNSSAAQEPNAGIGEVMKWSNMANFFIAAGMLLVGVRVANELGVEGGSMLNKAVDFGKKVATIGTGVAAGMWVAGKARDVGKGGLELAKKGGIEVADLAFDVSGKYERVVNFAKRQQESYRSWRADTGQKIATTVNEKGVTVEDRDAEGNLYYERKNKAASIDEIVGENEEETKRLRADAVKLKDGTWAWGDIVMKDRGKLGGFWQGRAHKRRAELIASRKMLEKTTNFAKNREELLDKRTKGVPTGWWMRDDEKMDALDRMEQGMLEGERVRSQAKTKEFQALGKRLVTANKRMQDGIINYTGQTISEQVAAHEIEAERAEMALDAGKAKNRRRYAAGEYKFKGKTGEEAIKKTIEIKVEKEDAESTFKALTGDWHLDLERGEDLLTDFKLERGIEMEDEEKRLRDTGNITEADGLKNRREALLDGDHKILAAELANEYKRLKQEGDDLKTKIKNENDPDRKKTLEEELVEKNEEARLLRLGDLNEKAHESEAKAHIIEDTLKSAENAGAFRAKTAFINSGAKEDERALREFEKLSTIHAQIPEAKEIKDNLEKINQTIKEDDKNILKLNRKLAAEKKEGNTEEIEKIEKELELAVEGKAQKVIDRKMNEDALRKLDKNDEVTKKQRKEQSKKIEKIRSGSLTWMNARAKAVEAEESRFFSTRQNKLLSSVEQQVIWDKRGIVTPTTAITELIEKYEKDFSLMSYEVTVSNMRSALKDMADKKQKGLDTEADKATLMGLFKHTFNQSRVDDAIISVMGDSELKETFKEIFDWKDWEFTPDKINQVQMMFASGMDKNFGKIHKEVSLLMKKYADDFGRDSGAFFEALQNGEEGEYFSDEDKNKFKELKTKLGKNTMKEVMEYYFKVQEDNEGAMQLLGNLRDSAINNNHPENAGHVQYLDVGGGKKMYVGVSAKQAQAYVNSDVNKLNVTKRAALHTHASANIDESLGAITEVRESDLALVRRGINNANDYRSTNGRFISQLSGLSDTDDAANFRDENNYFVADGVNKKTRKLSGATLAFRNKYVSEYSRYTKPEDKKKLDAHYLVENIYARHARANTADFIMNMANAAGIDPSNAVQTGKMKLKIMDAHGNVREFKKYSEFMEAYNNGDFNFDGKPPDEKLRPYIPPRKNNNEDDEDDGALPPAA